MSRLVVKNGHRLLRMRLEDVDPKHGPMYGENRPLVIDEPVGIHDFMKIIDHLRRIYGICLELIKETQIITTCNWLDTETLEC